MHAPAIPAASRRSAVEPFRAMDVLAEANRMIAAGAPVISLAVGQPSAPAPAAALAAARTMLEHGRIGYTDALGRLSLRRRIARHYAEVYGTAADSERVMVTTGSSAGFNLAFLAAFDHGDAVAIAEPGYPAYRNILKALGLVPVEIPVGAAENYILTADHLASVHRKTPVKGVLVASPANPTGTVTPRDELGRLVAFCDQANIRFISDEIYHGLAYGEATASALEFSDRPIIVNSFSKYYLMTGWRCGWLVLPPSLVRPSERVAQSLYISAPDLSQVAAEEAMDCTAELDEVKRGYELNRAHLMETLPSLGFSDIAPMDGAFYAYASIPERFPDAVEFARAILHETHVALTPGIDFDLKSGGRFVRISYAGDPRSIVEATDRMGAYLG